MIANFEDLVAPLGVGEALRLLGSREPRLFRRPGDRRLAAMFDWTRLRAVIEADRIKPAHLRVMWKERPLEAPFYRRDGKVDAALLDDLMTRGASVIANGLNAYVPELGHLCADLSERIGEEVRCGAIVTTGAGGALRLHYDVGDILVVQLEGSKRWCVYDSPVIDPVWGMRQPAAPDGPLLLDAILEPGDLLALPGGFWHHCENGPGLSHHIGFNILAPTGRDAVLSLLDDLADDELFRVRLTRMSEGQRRAHQAALRARLAGKIDALSLEPAAVLAAARRRLVKADDD